MSDRSKGAVRIWSIIAWLLLWHIISISIGQEILLVSPVAVLIRLLQLAIKLEFWQSILFSFIRIILGFLLAVFCSIILAAMSYCFWPIRELIMPVILVIKAIPVASIIILILIWIPSKNLSIIISFLIVLPIMYTNILNALDSTDIKLLEMAQLFQLPSHKRIFYIYMSQILPFFRAACSICLGLCWKAGIAAEVIGIPTGSIGEKLYKAKIYLNTPDLLAWTLTIIIISACFEWLFMRFINAAIDRLERI